jgi:hypothetical protein
MWPCVLRAIHALFLLCFLLRYANITRNTLYFTVLACVAVIIRALLVPGSAVAGSTTYADVVFVRIGSIAFTSLYHEYAILVRVFEHLRGR